MELETHSVERDICLVATVQRPSCFYNKGYIAYFTGHARNSHISISGLTSDVSIVFLEPDFVSHVRISVIPL